MKLSEYIYNKLTDGKCSMEPLTENDLDYWIVDWYNESFGKVPPLWLSNGERIQ